MNIDRMDEVIKMFTTDKSTKEKLKKLGLSDIEINDFMEALVSGKDTSPYFRVLAEDEKRVITTEAFGYLMGLLNHKSITKDMFERIISLSMQLQMFMKKRIDRQIMDEIVNFMVFSGNSDITVRELLDIFFGKDYEIEFDSEDIN